MLRDYQEEALDRIDAADRKGNRRQLGVAATGLGKTVIFTALAERRRCRTLVLAHRDELIGQAAGKVAEMWPELGVTAHTFGALRAMEHPAVGMDGLTLNPAGIGIVKAAADDVRAHVVVASVQTLARPERLERLTGAATTQTSLLSDDVAPFGLVIVDEAHHAAAESYRTILKALGAGEPDGPLLLGVTATPDRGDGVGLDDLFHTVVFNFDILWGIDRGYLSDIRGKAVRVAGLDVGSIKKTAGDFQAGDAGRALEDAGAPAVIARAIAKYAPDRLTLVFTPTVAVATEVAAECVGAGLAAEWISGETPHEDRKRILRDFEARRISVLANCAVLTEGYDNPAVDCVVIGRPTQSRALYTQMVGRGTRRHPDKDHLLVLDVVGGAEQHSLITIPSLFGLGGKLRTAARNGSRSLSDLADEHHREQVHAGAVKVADVEMFRKVRQAGIAWLPTNSKSAPRRRYARPMAQQGRREIPTVVLSQMEPGADVWTAGLEWPSTGAQRALITRVPMEMAQGVAEDAVRKLTPRSSLVNTDAEWRAGPPSPRMIRLAGKWHVNVTKGMTAGEVSDEIGTRVAKAEARKAEKLRNAARATTGVN
jgi:superfamily II DNA or RNA helicase